MKEARQNLTVEPRQGRGKAKRAAAEHVPGRESTSRPEARAEKVLKTKSP
jgi:hypothetical protein